MIGSAREALKKQEDAMPKYESVMAVTDDKPTDIAVHVRGSHLNQLETPTARGAPTRLTEAAPMTTIPSDRSGRLELARWFASPDQPLTSRVMANRIWMWHFGQPLMRSPSNFGLQSDPPVHRELLDYLARRLIDDGWSLKSMHRLIMLSNTYRMSSRSEGYESEDPENDWIWRQNRRRLEVEPLRDSLHFVGDSLDHSFGGPPEDIGSERRTVYLKINRAALFDLFSTFDYVETANHLEQRPVTTVPNQALFLMNNRLVHTQASNLATQTLQWKNDSSARIAQLWLRLLGRPPSDQETKLAISFISQTPNPSSLNSDPWEVLCRTLMAGSGFSYVE